MKRLNTFYTSSSQLSQFIICIVTYSSYNCFQHVKTTHHVHFCFVTIYFVSDEFVYVKCIVVQHSQKETYLLTLLHPLKRICRSNEQPSESISSPSSVISLHHDKLTDSNK